MKKILNTFILLSVLICYTQETNNKSENTYYYLDAQCNSCKMNKNDYPNNNYVITANYYKGSIVKRSKENLISEFKLKLEQEFDTPKELVKNIVFRQLKSKNEIEKSYNYNIQKYKTKNYSVHNIEIESQMDLNESGFIQEERIEFISQKDTLVGYLSKPTNRNSFPLIVVLHSASHGHHDNAIYNNLEKIMNEMGVGVFTFDRRGSGESTGNFNTASLELLADDALNAIHKLKSRKDVIHHKIGLFGISQGGWIAPIAFSKNEKDISFMILVSSSGVSPARQMEYSALTTLSLNGYSNEIKAKAKHLRNITNAYYRGNRDREKTQSEIDVFREKPWFNDVYLPWQGNLPEDVSITKWIHEMDLNPKNYFKTINVPTILFYGATDRWVPIDESIVVWKDCFKIVQNNNYTINQIRNSGHMMILNEDNNPKQEIISTEYELKLKNWIKKQINK